MAPVFPHVPAALGLCKRPGLKRSVYYPPSHSIDLLRPRGLT